MRKLSKIVMAAAVIMIIAAIVAACTTETPTPSESPKPDWMFTVGQDKVTVTAPGANQYAQTFNVNLKIVGGGGTELFNGVVTVTTNTQKLSEVVQAAVSDKGLAQNGIDVGFFTKIGDYENNSETSTYWMYTVNGETPQFGCNELQIRNNDYIRLYYEAITF
jgi:hypothetical protein